MPDILVMFFLFGLLGRADSTSRHRSILIGIAVVCALLTFVARLEAALYVNVNLA